MKLIKHTSAEKLRGGFYTPGPIAAFILKRFSLLNVKKWFFVLVALIILIFIALFFFKIWTITSEINSVNDEIYRSSSLGCGNDSLF